MRDEVRKYSSHGGKESEIQTVYGLDGLDGFAFFRLSYLGFRVYLAK